MRSEDSGSLFRKQEPRVVKNYYPYTLLTYFKWTYKSIATTVLCLIMDFKHIMKEFNNISIKHINI